MIIGWYGSIPIQNEEQHKLALDTANVFEVHRIQDTETVEDVLKEHHNHYPPHVLLSSETLPNKTLFSKLLKHMIGLGFNPHPDVPQNEMIQIKLAQHLPRREISITT